MSLYPTGHLTMEALGSPPKLYLNVIGTLKSNPKNISEPERTLWNASVISAAFQEVVADGHKDTLDGEW